MRILRSPLLHFLLLGIAIFVASRFAASRSPAELAAAGDRRIEIAPERQAELRKAFLEQMGRAPAEGEFRAMLSAEVDEEILYREALVRGLLENDGGVKTRLIQKMLFLEGGAEIEDAPALLERAQNLGLHEGDLVVRRILVQKMRLLGSTLAEEAQPTDRDIEAAFEAQAEALREPERRSLQQIFFSADRRQHAARADAAAALQRLVSGTKQEAAGPLGDPFPLGQAFEQRSERDLNKSFGARFGEESFATAEGIWSGPIESAYGFHLIRVDHIQSGEIPPLPRVHKRLRHQLEQERREEQLERLLSDLRTRYEIVLVPDKEPR